MLIRTISLPNASLEAVGHGGAVSSSDRTNRLIYRFMARSLAEAGRHVDGLAPRRAER